MFDSSNRLGNIQVAARLRDNSSNKLWRVVGSNYRRGLDSNYKLWLAGYSKYPDTEYSRLVGCNNR